MDPGASLFNSEAFKVKKDPAAVLRMMQTSQTGIARRKREAIASQAISPARSSTLFLRSPHNLHSSGALGFSEHPLGNSRSVPLLGHAEPVGRPLRATLGSAAGTGHPSNACWGFAAHFAPTASSWLKP
mmetsp:Transcript_123851/g.194267  ORF Transcript_123851/g.194267 Transcript_123851/m.194267 type:complete len:129 (-) Transcript_123851:90-476(-)